jgi:hypothetical protein
MTQMKYYKNFLAFLDRSNTEPGAGGMVMTTPFWAVFCCAVCVEISYDGSVSPRVE